MYIRTSQPNEQNYCQFCNSRCGFLNVEFTFDYNASRQVQSTFKHLCLRDGTQVVLAHSGDDSRIKRIYFGLRHPYDAKAKIDFTFYPHYVVSNYRNLTNPGDFFVRSQKRRSNFHGNASGTSTHALFP